VSASPFLKLLSACAVLGMLGGAGYAGWRAMHPAEPQIHYRTAPVERGPIAAAVEATGTLNAVLTVQVGAQVSGRVSALYADYNAEIRRGQTLARIDPEPYELRIVQGEADAEAARRVLAAAQSGVTALNAQVARARVAGLRAQRELERTQVLAERGFVAPAETTRAETAHRDALAAIAAAEAQVAHQETQVESARAALRQRETALAAARADLERTYVRAPVDGIVISRSVDVGQTVSAGAASAALFTIARNLREMQVDTAVGEADVGKLRPGQAATFTVDAFPRRVFEGRVEQVRKAPQRHADGVRYTAVVAAPNADLVLLPGMTARVRVAVDSRADALKVPNAALAFRADEASLALAGIARVWRLGESRRPEPLEVRLGVTDGRFTEIVGGELAEGDTLVLGAVTTLPQAARTR
jgi:HlyD family secretion protein